MNSHPPSHTPLHRSTTRCKGRKSIESYLKSKYPDSAFHNLKFVKSSDEENGVESKPIAGKSENKKANVRKHSSSIVKHIRLNSPVENEQGDSKVSKPPHPTMVRESDVGVGLKNRRERPKKNHTEPQIVCYSSSPVTAISRSVQGEDLTDGKLNSAIVKLIRCSSLVENGGGPSKNQEPAHSTKMRQSDVGVGLKNCRGRLKKNPGPRKVCYSSSPVSAISKIVQGEVRTNVKLTSPIVTLMENGGEPSKNPEPTHSTKMRQSDIGVGLKNRQGRLEKNHPGPRKVCYSSSPVTAISKSVQGEGRNNGKLTYYPIVKLIQCSSLMENGEEPSKNPEPTHSTKMRQSDVTVCLKNRRGRPKKNHPEPRNVCYSSSPVTAISNSVQGEGRNNGKLTYPIVKLIQCSSLMENGGEPSKNPEPTHSTQMRQSDVGVGLKNRRGRQKKNHREPHNVCYSCSPVTAVSNSVQGKGRTDGKHKSPKVKLIQCSPPMDNGGEPSKNPENRQGRPKKNHPEPRNVCYSSSSVTAISESSQAKGRTGSQQNSPVMKLNRSRSSVENNPTVERQSGVGLTNARGRLKKNKPELQNVIDSSSPNIVNIGTHGSTSKTYVNSNSPPVGKPKHVNNNDGPMVDTLNTTASSLEIMYMGNHHTNSEKLVFKNLPVVKLERLEVELDDCLKQYGFVSASRLEMGLAPHLLRTRTQTKRSRGQKVPFAGKGHLKDTPSKSVKSSAAPENVKYSLSNDTKNRTQDQVYENSGKRSETNSNQFLGLDSPEKTLSFRKCSTTHNCVVAAHNASRSKVNRRSTDKESKDTKHSHCESTEDILTNGAKRLEVGLHDLRLDEQSLKRKAIEDRPSKLKKTSVVQSPRKSSESHSSIQPENTSANPRVLRRLEHPAKKRKIQLTAAKNIGKVDDVVEVLDSDSEQNSNAVPMIMQPIVVQQIVMQPIVMHNYTYQLPNHGRGDVGSMNQCDDIISIISSDEGLDSSDSENEVMVKSLINPDPDCSELQDICYISEEPGHQALSDIKLEDFCCVSEETSSERLSLPDAAVVNTSCNDEVPSDYNDDPSNQEESFTKKETSLSFCSDEKGLLNGTSKGPLSLVPPNEGDSSEKGQNEPRTLDGSVEESRDSCKLIPVIRVLTNQEDDSFSPNKSRPSSSTELVENMGTVDMELLSIMPSNEDCGARDQPRLLNNLGKSVALLSGNEQNHHSCSELPSDLNDLSNQKGVFNTKEDPSGLPTNCVEIEALGERGTSPVSNMLSNEGIIEDQIRLSTCEVTVCKPSLVGASCEIDISDAIIQGKIALPDENPTVLEGIKEVQNLLSTPEVSDHKQSLVEESRESCCDSLSDQNDLANQENGFNPIQNPSVAPAAPIEDMDALEGTCRSSLCKMSSNESAEEIQIQSCKPELLVDKSPFNDEDKESCSKLAHSDPTSHSEASNIDENLLVSPLCEISSTGGTMEDEIQSRSPKLSGNELNFDYESRESACESSSDGNELASEEKCFTRDENHSATPADLVEYVETLAVGQKERLPPSVSYRQGLLDDENSEASSKLSPDHNDMSNQKIGFTPNKNRPISPVQSVENMEALGGTKDDRPFASELPVEQLSLDGEGREPFSESPLIYSDVTNLENGFNPVLNQSVSPAENLNALSAVESVENTEALKGVKKNKLQPCAPESTVEEPLLDEESTKSYSRLSLIHDDVTNKNNGFTPAVNQSVSPADSPKNMNASSPVKYIYNMEALEGAKNNQLQPCTSELSVEEPSHGEESTESCSRSLLIHDDLNSEENGSSTPDASSVTRLLDKVNHDISFIKPLLPSYLDETIQGARIIPEKTSPTTQAESTKKQPFSETGEGSFNQTTTNRYNLPMKDCCLPPEQCKPSSSLGEVCRVSFGQAPAGDESTLEEHFTLENGFPPSLCTSTENPPFETRDRDSAYQWEHVVAEKTHCSVYVENGSSEGKNADSEQMPLDYNSPESDLTPEYAHKTPSSMTHGDDGPLIKGYHSSNSVDIDKYLSGCNNTEFRDNKKESVSTDTSFSENTFFNVEEELDRKCSQGTPPADFLEMSDYTEALVDACLRENLPISSDDCLPSMHVIESSDFPSVSGSNKFLGESARGSGQLAETGVIANSPVEFDNECLDLHHLPTISNSVDFGDQNVSSPPSTGSHPPELIFDGFFYESDEPINFPTEGDLNTELCKDGSKSEEMQSTLIHKSHFNNDKVLNIIEVDTDFLSQSLLNSSQPDKEVNLSFEPTHPSSSSGIVTELSGETSCWQSTRDVSLTVVPRIAEAQNRLEKCAVPEKKLINVGSEISSKINDLLFDEEFEQSNNVTPMKRTTVEKIMSPGQPTPVGSNPSALLFDEEFESSNNSTPMKKIRVGPSVTVSRVCSRTSSELLFDEEFERSNNFSPVKKQMDGKRRLRSASPQEVRVTSLGLVDELLIDENDKPPLNSILESVNDINERSVSRNTSVGCVVISSDEESENPPISNYPGISHTNSPRPINRPAVHLPNEAKTSLNNHQISAKSEGEPIATNSPRMVGKPKGRNPPQKQMPENVSDTESGSEFADSPPRKISKLSVSDEETSDLQNLKELASSGNQLKDRDEGNHCNEVSSERPSEIYWTHCAPIEPDEISPIDLGGSDSEIDAESRNLLPCSPCAPEKSNVAASISSIEVTRDSGDVVELTDSDAENAPNRDTVNPYEHSNDFLDEFIESDDSFKGEKNDQDRPPSLPKQLSAKPLLSSQRQDFIKNYSQQLVELAETIYRKKQSSALKISPSKSQPTRNSPLVASDSEHSSDSMSVGDFIESDDGLFSGEEDATTSPRVDHSILGQSLNTTKKSTTTALQNSGVSAKKPKVVGPSSYRFSLNTSIHDKIDIVSSDEDCSANSFMSPKPLSKPPLRRRLPSILKKPTVVHQKNTTSKTAAPTDSFKRSSICRGIPLDDRGNCGSGSNVGNNSSHIPSPEALPSKPVFSTQVQTLLKMPATVNLTVTRSATSAEKSKPLPKEKLPSSTSQGKDNSIVLLHGGTGRSISSKSPSLKPGSSRQSQKVFKKRAPTTRKAKKLPENTALRSLHVSKLVSTTPARKIDLGHQSDSDQRPLSAHDLDSENGDNSGHLTTPDFLSSKLVLSRQSLNFIKSITQNRSKSTNTARNESKLLGNQSRVTANTKKILIERSTGCPGRRVS